MKSLKTVQKLSKLGKILSKIVFICCIVGFCGCVAGIVSLAAGMSEMQVGNLTIKGLIEKEAETTIGTLYAGMAAGAILCAGEAVLARFAVHYFERELKDGTPFVTEGTKELQRLGILAICIPIAAQFLAVIAYAIVEYAMDDVSKNGVNFSASVGIGVMMIVTAQICKYGAELREGKKDALPEGGEE